MKRAFVTGGAGFIGSQLVERLLALGTAVTVYDNLSTGRRAFLARAGSASGFAFVEADLQDEARLAREMAGHDVVFHLAANADVRFGTRHPRKDLEQNTIVTSNVLEAMRANSIRRLVFASTGSIYGEPSLFPTPEDAPFPVQTSLYGASKLACEGLIQAYAAGFGIQGLIFRFVSVVGERYTHGHVLDFYRQLREHPGRLSILGDGKQRKSYLYAQDCLDAILLVLERERAPVAIYNLGTDEHCTVDDSIGWITGHLGLAPERTYAGGQRGWVGDSPFIFLDCSRIRQLGWRPALSIREAILRTLQYLVEDPDGLEAGPRP